MWRMSKRLEYLDECDEKSNRGAHKKSAAVGLTVLALSPTPSRRAVTPATWGLQADAIAGLHAHLVLPAQADHMAILADEQVQSALAGSPSSQAIRGKDP